ncbi:hypothetical protein P7K49_011086 [Saguinus oedipus]|uniref:Uncharacterized protein n=1 Tax=Saguinus oedipus TaxID=9490 RepID=A0ABQ9VQ96_SAGOE|nr:hypothetical protein P7K49_011086 [Saguinus oedipus]
MALPAGGLACRRRPPRVGHVGTKRELPGDLISSRVNRSLPSSQALPPPLSRRCCGEPEPPAWPGPALPKARLQGPAPQQTANSYAGRSWGGRGTLSLAVSRTPTREHPDSRPPTPHFPASRWPLEGQPPRDLDLHSEPAFLRSGKDPKSSPASSPSFAVQGPKVRSTGRREPSGGRELRALRTGRQRGSPCAFGRETELRLPWVSSQERLRGRGWSPGAERVRARPLRFCVWISFGALWRRISAPPIGWGEAGDPEPTPETPGFQSGRLRLVSQRVLFAAPAAPR